MAASFLVIQDGSKYGNDLAYLTKCEACGNNINNVQIAGDATCLFSIVIQCQKCKHQIYGFTNDEMNIRFLKQFTPLYCNPKLIQDPENMIEFEDYCKYLDFLNEGFLNFAIEFGIGDNDISWVNLHLMKYHRDATKKMIRACERDVSKYRSRTHTNCFMCNSDKNLEHHHIIPVVEGGDNSKKNLISLCRDCHVKIHSLNKMAGRV